jgi:methylenetetrahydrofolate dehydrogenase (NADP+)/methenyltetrahydrofolate cyclohydrolase
MRLLEETGVKVAGKRAIVIGRSNLVGKPIAALLLAQNATVTIAHSRTEDLAARCREAEIVIAAVGKTKLVGKDWIQPGATVIDVGMNRDEHGKLCGDVDFAAVEPIAGAITPVPGGVGPMTIAMLLDNTLSAAKARVGAR